MTSTCITMGQVRLREFCAVCNSMHKFSDRNYRMQTEGEAGSKSRNFVDVICTVPEDEEGCDGESECAAEDHGERDPAAGHRRLPQREPLSGNLSKG